MLTKRLVIVVALAFFGALSSAWAQATHLFDLVKTATEQTVQDAISKGVDINARDSTNGLTLLMTAAAFNQDPEVITTLLKASADINARSTPYGMTALMFAATFNPNPQVVIVLLKAGADAKAKDSQGKTAFDDAQSNEMLRGTDAYRALRQAQDQ